MVAMDNSSHSEHLLEYTGDNAMVAQESNQMFEHAPSSHHIIDPSALVEATPRTLRHRDGFGRLTEILSKTRDDYYLRPKDGRLDILRVQRSDRISNPSPAIMKVIRYVYVL